MAKTFKQILFGVIVLGGFWAWCGAEAACGQACTGESPTWTCSDANYECIQTTINAATAGDTINVTATGSVSWPGNAIAIPSTKPLNLIGPGHAHLTIVLGDTYPVMINYHAADGNIKASRISGFKFQSPLNTRRAAMRIQGKGWHIDHCLFENLEDPDYAVQGLPMIFTTGINVNEPPEGLVDNNVFINSGVGTGGASTAPQHYAIWTRPSVLGTSHTVVVEDNIFVTTTNARKLIMDTSNGGDSFTFRYNDVIHSWMQTHGIQSNYQRGSKSWEYYGNKITAGSAYTEGMSGMVGTGVMFGNSISTPGSYTFTLGVYHERADADSRWSMVGYCDGTSWIDGNEDSTGYPCRDQVGTGPDIDTWHVYAPGACTDNGSGKVRVPLVGHNLLMTDQFHIAGGSIGCAASSLTGKQPILAIGTDYVDLDVDYVSGLENTPWQTYILGHPSTQSKMPAYVWRNYDDGAIKSLSREWAKADPVHIVKNRDWFEDDSVNCPANSSATCASGVGCGRLNDRPATCAVGTAYWATDQSCSNITAYAGASANVSGGGYSGTRNASSYYQGTLYKCGPTGWADGTTYSPLAYPHPLRATSDTAPPAAPGGLTVQ